MLSEEGDRYRAPISKYRKTLAAVTGLFFFGNYYNPLRISGVRLREPGSALRLGR
jgi:hypothetical protein